jgi:signal transduction histidine kinase
LTPAEIVGRTPFDFTFPEEVQRLQGAQEARIDGQTTVYELRLRTRLGDALPVLITAVPRVRDGQIIGSIAVITDLSSQKAIEAQLQKQSEELELLNRSLENRVHQEVELNRSKDLIMHQQGRHAAMGEMISNIAHQWRQPLNSLGLIVQNLQEAHEFGELTQDYLRAKVTKAMELIRYMSQTIDDFRSFFRPDKEKRPFSVQRTIERSISLVESNFRAHAIEVKVEAPEDLTVIGYENECAQVLLNLMNNARDAIQEHKIPHGRVELSLAADGDWAVVAVRDNGGGIRPEHMDRLFSPYFTTKDPGKGTGLGLYMAKMIVENNMNGHISASNRDDGVEFALRLPLA